MGLRDAFQKGAQTIRKGFGDVPREINYQVHVTTAYDAAEGSTVAEYTTTSAVKAFFMKFSTREIDGQTVRPNDRRVIIAARDIASITPKTPDRFTRVDTGEVFEVVDVKTDPAEAAWELQARQP